MPSFPCPDFVQDGVHLTPVSGLEYIYHLFDSSKAIIELRGKTPDIRQDAHSEAVRALEDRVMANEQDHKRLCSSFDAKVAVDAELADFQENVRNEVYFVVSGLPRISPELRGRDWQNKAVSDVQKLIRTLLSKELPIVVVQNITGRGQESQSRYLVRMEFAAHSQEIRSKFGSYFIGGSDNRPQEFKEISISNRVTPGTQVRLAILRLLAKRYEASNPGSKTKVIGFESRPLLRIVPPSGSDKRVRNFHFIDAIKSLPTNFTPTETKAIMLKIDPKFKGRIRSTFVVLSDDDFSTKAPGSGSIRKRGHESLGDSSGAPDPKR
jgi:hypothetical protein